MRELRLLLACFSEVSVGPGEVCLGAKIGRPESRELVGRDVEGLAAFGLEVDICSEVVYVFDI